MFKQLTQIGKNLTDELAKGLNEDLGGINSEQLDKNGPYSSLPNDVQIKLRKFEKYEQKYPLLLQAYKNEKLKSEKVEQIQTVLSEHTPVSDLSDIESLKSYFQNMDQKTNMLNEEVKRLTLRNTELVKESREVDTEELEKTKMMLNEAKKEKNVLNSEIEHLKQELGTKDRLVDSFKSKIEELTSSATQAVKAEAVNERDEDEHENERAGGQNSQQFNPKAATGSSKKKNQKKKKGKNNQSGRSSSEIQPQQQQQQQQQPQQPDDEGTEIKATIQTAHEIAESITLKVKLESLQSDYDVLRTKCESLETTREELEKLKQEIKTKDEELESVREMLREVGNDLVEAQNKLKDSSKAGSELNQLKLQFETLRNNNAENLKSYELKQTDLTNEVVSLKKTEASFIKTDSDSKGKDYRFPGKASQRL